MAAPGFALSGYAWHAKRRTKGRSEGNDADMHYVYVIRSISTAQLYVGAKSDLKKRLSDHNSGRSPHTSKFIPWELERYLGFPEKQQAYDFEKYLKSNSGRAFTSKHLVRNHTGRTDSNAGVAEW